MRLPDQTCGGPYKVQSDISLGRFVKLSFCCHTGKSNFYRSNSFERKSDMSKIIYLCVKEINILIPLNKQYVWLIQKTIFNCHMLKGLSYNAWITETEVSSRWDCVWPRVILETHPPNWLLHWNRQWNNQIYGKTVKSCTYNVLFG